MEPTAPQETPKLRFGQTSTATPPRENPLPKLLALFRAKGLTTEDVAGITGMNLGLLQAVLADYGEDRFAELCTHYSTKVSKGSEERIKVAAELAIGRCISILSNPATSSKEVIMLAKDFMDRHFGKALQRTEFVGTFQVGDGNKEIESNLAAANKRLEELMKMRTKMLESREQKTVNAEFEVVSQGIIRN